MSAALFQPYRKRPVVVSAIKFTMENRGELISRHFEISGFSPDRKLPLHKLWIDTLEGGHIATAGDFIISGIKGELYPCKPEIFAATYEAVES